MMYNLLIISNDHECISQVITSSNEVASIDLTGIALTLEEGISILKQRRPEIIVIDAQLTNSLEATFRNEVKQYGCTTIFVSETNSFAANAFRFSAIGYLLKPIDQNKLTELFEKFHKIRISTGTRHLKILHTSTSELMLHLMPEQQMPVTISLKEIQLVKALSNGIIIYTSANKEFFTPIPISEFHQLLLNFGYYALNPGLLVNMNYISNYTKEGDLTLTDGTCYTIPLLKRKDLQLKLNKYFLS